jgi:hypothetical protein
MVKKQYGKPLKNLFRLKKKKKLIWHLFCKY